MTIEQLRAVHQASPFQPFTLHLADGKVLRVPHRELLSHSESGRTIVVHQPNETFSVVDLLLVTRLEVENGVRRGNGSRRRRQA
jgi:hypothetical protein